MSISIPKLPFLPPLPDDGTVPAPHPKQQELDRVFYPESDGKPIAESTLQFQWIETIKGGLESLFADNPHVFIAADLLWYPVEGQPGIVTAPNALVVFGRPKGHRGSYLQWREANIPPQVVFEVLSPSNTPAEMEAKREFYQRHGVLEYYQYDPVDRELLGFVRDDPNRYFSPQYMEGWVSPRLGIRFDREPDGQIRLLYPDGSPFLSYVELHREREAAERARLIAEEQREAAEERSARLAARLRELGIDPENF
ncbi:MAG: Uma2 family endonuclease [Armatimonadaceae bacterium]